MLLLYPGEWPGNRKLNLVFSEFLFCLPKTRKRRQEK
jgi:hypothetical protein